MRVACVIPAHNEAPTVAAVVRAALESRLFSTVLVVDDGSRDATAAVARAAGARVLSLSPNRGKGQAMRAAFDLVMRARDVGAITFCDADLLNVGPHHFRDLTAPLAPGVSQVVGLRDHGRANVVQLAFPPISGQRTVRVETLARVAPHAWTGYQIEMGINAASDATGRTHRVFLDGLGHREKMEKIGLCEGRARLARMAQEVLCAWRDTHGK